LEDIPDDVLFDQVYGFLSASDHHSVCETSSTIRNAAFVHHTLNVGKIHDTAFLVHCDESEDDSPGMELFMNVLWNALNYPFSIKVDGYTFVCLSWLMEHIYSVVTNQLFTEEVQHRTLLTSMISFICKLSNGICNKNQFHCDLSAPYNDLHSIEMLVFKALLEICKFGTNLVRFGDNTYC
jgi:hypothetical protein